MSTFADDGHHGYYILRGQFRLEELLHPAYHREILESSSKSQTTNVNHPAFERYLQLTISGKFSAILYMVRGTIYGCIFSTLKSNRERRQGLFGSGIKAA